MAAVFDAAGAGLCCDGRAGAGSKGAVARMPESASPATPRLRLLGEARCWPGDGRALPLEPKDAALLAYVAICGPTAERRSDSVFMARAVSEA